MTVEAEIAEWYDAHGEVRRDIRAAQRDLALRAGEAAHDPSDTRLASVQSAREALAAAAGRAREVAPIPIPFAEAAFAEALDQFALVGTAASPAEADAALRTGVEAMDRSAAHIRDLTGRDI